MAIHQSGIGNVTFTTDAATSRTITDEINANPEEVESLRRSRRQAEEGDVRWLADHERVEDVTDSD